MDLLKLKKVMTVFFVHRSDLANEVYLHEGEKVQFEVEETKNGLKATNVKPIFLSAF